MNDETEPKNNTEHEKSVDRRPPWQKILDEIFGRWMTHIGIIVMAISYAGMYFCAEEMPDGPHCATEQGNVTCVERYGGEAPYCDRASTIYHGCMFERPPPEYAAPCGQLEDGLPGDPDCSKIVTDNPPSAETLAKWERAEIKDKLISWFMYIVAAGALLYTPFLLTRNSFFDFLIRRTRSLNARFSVEVEPAKLPAPSLTVDADDPQDACETKEP